jgi:ribosomal protein S26
LSEIEAMHFCKKCNKETLHMFGGSGRNGSCEDCGNILPKDESCDMKRVVAQSVVDLDSDESENDEAYGDSLQDWI